MSAGPQSTTLFDLGPDGPASRALRAAPPVTDAVLLRDVIDAASVLALGEAGVSASTVAMLRGEVLAAVRELARRWGS